MFSTKELSYMPKGTDCTCMHLFNEDIVTVFLACYV